MALQATPFISTTEPLNSVPGSSDRHAQPLTAGNFEKIWNLDKILVRVMRSVIVHKNNVTQTDDHQSECEFFWSCSYDPNQNKRTIGFQLFDTGLFIISLKTSTKKIRKALKIILLQF